MSAQLLTRIVCDGPGARPCPEQKTETATLHRVDLRHKLTRAGWDCATSDGPDVDRCAGCRSKASTRAT